jgi:hypothetical protein
MTFGHGNHYCTGKNDFRHCPMFIARGLRELHLEFDA